MNFLTKKIKGAQKNADLLRLPLEASELNLFSRLYSTPVSDQCALLQVISHEEPAF